MTTDSKLDTETNKDSPVDKKVQKRTVTSLKKREIIFLAAASLILVIVVPYMHYTRKVYLHIYSDAHLSQAGPEFNAKPSVIDFWISIVSGIVFFWAKRWVTACLFPLVRAVAVRSPDENDEMHDYKSGKSAAKAWNTLFHAGSALGAYLIMMGKPWHPWFLGGTGALENGFLNMPFGEMDKAGYYFGLIIYGHPLQQAFAHFFLFKRGPDFAEMSLHHLVHLCVSSSYLIANIIPVGIFIGFIHDASDIFVSSSKGFHLAGYEKTSIANFLLAMFLWFALRLVALPMIIYFLTSLKFAEDRAYLQPYLTISWVLLCFLLVLHVFWFYLFLKMIHMALFKGEVRDLQKDVVK